MSEHELERRIEKLEQLVKFELERFRYLEHHLDVIEALIRDALKILDRLKSPAAPTLAASFTSSGDSMNATLVATIPTTRQDGTALAATDIGSITYQKTSLGADGVTPGPETTLQVNSAVGGAGLQLTDLTFTDSAANTGDAYTCFVTDTAGNVGALSNAVTDTEVAPPPVLSPPSAPSLSGTFA